MVSVQTSVVRHEGAKKNKTGSWLVIGLTAFLCSFGASHANATAILDGSFETPAVGSNTSNCLVLAGCFGFDIGNNIGAWTVIGPGGAPGFPPIIILSNNYISEPPRLFTANTAT